ncbi:hypothetical protein Tco_0394188, partial [Tanacetum coccineum]
FYTSAGNPVKEILKLNLPDHRILKDGHGDTWFQLTHRFIATCSYPTDKHKDIMKAQLRNEITKFEKKSYESLFEAWERYKLSIDRCPNHNMLLVTQIDTFYNGLTLSHRDTINAAVGGTFMKKTPEECYELIENMTIHHNHWTSATRDETSRNISSTTSIESPKLFDSKN